MRIESCLLRILTFVVLTAAAATPQVYSPNLLRQGQPDPTDLHKFASAICRQANAHTPREKADAIWRFFLTDGRFVKPGFWYHIAGWTYEEPSGEVLDPIKLLNSYGFGLCYHIAPLLAAIYDAANFEDARVWFLTGHTVAEVFFDGTYHYFDSDMMGYNVEGVGPFRGKPVVSVHQLEGNSDIILDKLLAPNKVKPGVVDNPWYPADVGASAMQDLSDLFTTKDNNSLYLFTRYAPGHSMDFVLRPGEKLIRYFQPEKPGLYYLPYQWNGTRWTEFPKEISQYQIRTADGPRSQKDKRSWATGRIEYTPPAPDANQAVTVIDMPSPYVLIDAQFSMNADLASSPSALLVETSIDGGKTWDRAEELTGPHHGAWRTAPRVLVTSAHGRKTAVSGTYGYQLRVTKRGKRKDVHFSSLHLISRFQLNPRALPSVTAGSNQFDYSAAAPVERIAVSAPLDHAPRSGLKLVSEQGQDYLLPAGGHPGTVLYKLETNGALLTGFDAGARFLDLRRGLAPDKLTAETRRTTATSEEGTASLDWATSPNGPFQNLWTYPTPVVWRDGVPIDRLLLWPEVFRKVRELPAGTRAVYVKFSTSGPAIDSIRLTLYKPGPAPSGKLKITQLWREGNTPRRHVETIAAGQTQHAFRVTAGPDPRNEAVIFENQSDSFSQ